MNKLKIYKKDIKRLLILILLAISLIIIFANYTNIFGSTKDYINQHAVFPNYLRELFYETGNLFPNFALNLGGGQNIYNISYYGLFNPIILLSYLFPFVKMITYIQFSMVVCIIISIILIYYFLRKRFNMNISFIATLLFLTSASFIFHFHRHIMFIDYMPFLLLALIGTDKYFEKKKSKLLVISIFLMILTSYYFSIVGLVTIFLYATFKYLEINKSFNKKHFIKEMLKFILIMIIPVLMSCFLLLPTFYTLLSSRSDTNNNIKAISLLFPSFDISKTLYSTYSVGLTAIFIISVIDGIISTRKDIKFINITLSILLIFPIFNYIFNGFMYINGKAFIPLLPLAIITIASFLNRLLENEKMKRSCSITLLIAVINIIIFFQTKNQSNLIFFIDTIFMILFTVISIKLKKKTILNSYLIITSLIMTIISNYNETYITKEYYKSLELTKNKNYVQKILNNDNNFYRISDQSNKLDKSNYIYDINHYLTSIYSSLSNPYYKDFYNNLINNEFMHRSNGMLTGNNNIFYNFYMGNKYLLNSSNNMIGYNKIDDNIYKNENVLPLGYSTNKIMSKDYYNSLDYFEKLDAYMNYAIIDKNINSNLYNKKIRNYNPSYKILLKKNLDIKNENGIYYINAKPNNKLRIKMNNINEKDILLLKFKMLHENECSDNDQYIQINDVVNKLTCKSWKYHNNNYTFEYSISNTDILEITFSEGKFELNNFSMALYNYDNLVNVNKEISPFIVDRNKTKGDIIEGKIDVKENSYFKLSIPYDNGFTIYVDGKKTNYELVNQAFIGFKINKGVHNIKIVYQAELFKESIIISIVGILLFIGLCLKEKKNKI